jgi:D-psicose/D-tagatose/L-ribulose 3-epimerase
MKFGCCTNMVAHCSDGTGIEHLEKLQEFGYDYIELPLAQIMDLTEDQFQRLLDRLEASDIKCEACNNFFPARIRLTGPEVNYGKVKDYIRTALDRLVALGVKIVVFGSSGAKNVPPGFSGDVAWEQLVLVLREIDRFAKPRGITVVIEPLNRMESNIVILTAEGLQLVRDVQRESINLLVDYYHLMMEKEDLGILLSAGQYIKHIHFANPEGRVFPHDIDGNDYPAFFTKLKQIGYHGRISVEAYTKDFSNDAAKSLALLKELTV